MQSLVFKDMDDFKRQWPQQSEILQRGFDGGKPIQADYRRPARNSLSNRKLHAMLGDIRKQAVIELEGAKIPMSCYESEVVKAFMVRWFDIEMKEQGEPLRKSGRHVVCPLTGDKMYVRPSTKDLSQKECCDFIEWLYQWGVNNGVTFSDPAMAVYEEYAKRI